MVRVKSTPFPSLPECSEDVMCTTGFPATVAPVWWRQSAAPSRGGDSEDREMRDDDDDPRGKQAPRQARTAAATKAKSARARAARAPTGTFTHGDAEDTAPRSLNPAAHVARSGDDDDNERLVRKPRPSNDADRKPANGRALPGSDAQPDKADPEVPRVVSAHPMAVDPEVILTELQECITQAILAHGEPMPLSAIYDAVAPHFRKLRKRDGTLYTTDCRKAVISVLRHHSMPNSLFNKHAGDMYSLNRPTGERPVSVIAAEDDDAEVAMNSSQAEPAAPMILNEDSPLKAERRRPPLPPVPVPTIVQPPQQLAGLQNSATETAPASPAAPPPSESAPVQTSVPLSPSVPPAPEAEEPAAVPPSPTLSSRAPSEQETPSHPLTDLQLVLGRALLHSPLNALSLDELVDEAQRSWSKFKKRDATLSPLVSEPKKATVAALNQQFFSHNDSNVYSLTQAGREALCNRIKSQLLELPSESRTHFLSLSTSGAGTVLQQYLKNELQRAQEPLNYETLVELVSPAWPKIRGKGGIKHTSDVKKSVENALKDSAGMFTKGPTGLWSLSVTRQEIPILDAAPLKSELAMTELQYLIARLIVRNNGMMEQDRLVDEVMKEWPRLRRKDGSPYYDKQVNPLGDCRRAVHSCLSNSQVAGHHLFRREPSNDKLYVIAYKPVLDAIGVDPMSIAYYRQPHHQLDLKIPEHSDGAPSIVAQLQSVTEEAFLAPGEPPTGQDPSLSQPDSSPDHSNQPHKRARK
eukprot:TRINITY_DN1431_c0_g1_i1.p1 TRINITY_DN1431_c0_g1~~TRINITY_DN1431_c0_g1_i1.p1  ORF type:complete len:762 (+),score=119.97 TRINITY_DN1431_c0_g1_i1:35-2287(+)